MVVRVDQPGDDHPLARIKNLVVAWRVTSRDKLDDLVVFNNKTAACIFGVDGQGVFDPGARHGEAPVSVALPSSLVEEVSKKMVGGTGIEPVATTMSTWCSTAELTAQPICAGPKPTSGPRS